MNKFCKLIATAAFAVSAGALSVANAAPVTLSNITGAWSNVTPNSITPSGNGTASASIAWGNPATNAGPSSYVFDAAGTINTDVPPDQMVTLGVFTHNNNSIFSNSVFLDSASLTVSADINVDGTDLGNFDFVFDFTHDETPNTGGGCCNDLVTISDSSLSQDFLVNGVLYTIAILGFQVGSDIVTTFSTVEGAVNSANLVGTITVSDIPVPGALVLMFSGLAGLSFVRRKGGKAKA